MDKTSSSDKTRSVYSFSAEAATKSSSTSKHKLELIRSEGISMSGVTDVPVFTDKNVTVRLQGETLLITGQNLSVKNLDVENGRLSMTGQVNSLRYTTQTTPTSLAKRIFK